jgi:hypothetical protein
MKRTALVFLFAAAALAADRPDFTGYWELNIGRSKFGKMPKPVRMALNAARDGDRLKAEQTTWDNEGHQSVTGTWYLDGKDHPAEAASQALEKTWWQGNTLVNEKKSLDRTFVENVRMTLSPDGKTATEVVRVKSPNGDNTEVLVWEKRSKPVN